MFSNWGLTKNEKLFFLFIIVSFLIGTGLKLFRHHFQWELSSATFNASRLDSLRQKFVQRSQEINQGQLANEMAPHKKQAPIKQININDATIDDLTQLPRIGPVLAGRIVQYRKEKGRFLKKEDIQKVNGIGAKTFQQIKSYITVN